MRFESQDFIKSQRQWRESRDRIPITTKPKTATTPEKIGNVTSFSRSMSSRNSNSSNIGSSISNSIHRIRYKYRNDYESRKQHKQEGTFVAVSNNDASSRDDDNDDADNAHHRRICIQENNSLFGNNGKMEYNKNDEKELLTAKTNNTDFLPDFSKKELEHLQRSRRIKQTATATAICHNDENKKELNCGLCDFIPTTTEQEYNNTTCNAAAAAAAATAIRTDYKSSSSRNDYRHTTNDDHDRKGYGSSKGNVSENLESYTDRITDMYEEYTDEIRIGSVKAFLNINDQIKNTMHIHAGAGTKSGSNDQQQKQKQKMKSARCSHSHYNSKEGEVQVQVVNFIVDAAILFNVLPNHVWSENFLKDSRGALNKIQERMILDYNHDNN
jgi:hypothetical protein